MATPRQTLFHLTPLAAVGGCEVNCLRVLQGLEDYDHHVLVFDDRGPMTDKWEAAGARVEHLAGWRSGRSCFESALTDWAQTAREPAGVFYWSTSRLPFVLRTLRHWGASWAVHAGNPSAPTLGNRARLLLHECSFAVPPQATLVACSGYVADNHRASRYYRGFPIETIYNPVASAFDRPRMHRSLPLGSGPRIGMVARLDAIKDHLTLLRAVAAISSVRDDVTLEFAGAGEREAFLRNEATRLGIIRRVRFLGTVADVPALISGWDVYVHSTTASEGMGTAVAEAMMAGLPCVVTDLPMMREVCGPSGGVYARPADTGAWGRTLHEVMGDRVRRAALGEAAQARARGLFSVRAVADQYLRLVRPIPVAATT